MGGSAFSKAIIKMATSVELGSDEVKNFAEVAGLSVKDFSKLFKEDAASAIQKFITGLSNTERMGKGTLVMLEEMGLTEVRLRDTLLRATNANELFSEAIKTGSKAWDENIALTTEANRRK